MGLDLVAWVAAEAGLPLLDEAPLRPNEAASALLGEARPDSLEAACGALFGQRPAEIDRVLSDARRGTPRMLHEGGYALLVLPASPGRARLLLLPPNASRAGALAARLELVELAAATAHELGNALGAIAGWAQIARRRGGAEAMVEALGVIEQTATSAHQSARAMLSVARGEDGDALVPIHMSALVHEVARLLAPKAAAQSVRIETQVDEGMHVRGTRAAALTIVWNLAQNAVEASPPGGLVRLMLQRAGPEVRFIVEDEGEGIPPDAVERLFQPYVTTKRDGTGLGLPLVRRAVTQLGGQIRVGTAGPRGARFEVTLRRVRLSARPSEPPPSDPRGSGLRVRSTLRGARVLVVDDDPATRDMVRTALALQGARVVATDDPEQVLEADLGYDLAVVDLALAGLRGDRLVAALRRRGLVRRVLLMSGADPPSDAASGGEPDRWLRKPFGVDDLIAAAQAVLAERRRASSGSRAR
ncbi:MAG: ATP-binding protein [Myxococcota bacterium]|nr:ATP-binding protein [Myxococcota bacterium]MDW8363364.1 ATP-binding protein [Myxococcales bacterium]